MLYFPWQNETELISSDQTYASKFYEPDVQAIVEKKTALFEPDVDAITEALESMRNNPGKMFIRLIVQMTRKIQTCKTNYQMI